MKYRPALTLAACALGILLGSDSLARRAAASAADPEDAFAQNRRLGRGVNVIGYDPLWRHADQARFKAEHFRLIREAGFQHVRINLHPFRDNPRDGGKIRDEWWKTLDWALDEAIRHQLLVILDFHEFEAMGRDPEGLKARHLAFWDELARRQRARPHEVLFEILNEPHGKYTPELWNKTLRQVLGVIRRTNPDRTVVIGPVQWNSVQKLETLSLPSDDRQIIATVHYYNPFEFTHQGAPWTNMRDRTGVTWKATAEEQAAVRRDFDKVQSWSRKEHRPIYLGEFGAYDKAEMPSRVRYIGFIAREAEKRGWSWGYWQFDGDFILYDIPKHHWIEPIRDALMPGAR